MNKKWQWAIGLLLCCGVVAILLAQEKSDKEKEKKKAEEYSATAIVTSGVAAGSMVQLTIRVESFTPDEEVLKLADILKNQGPDALARAMDKARRGRVSPVGRVGNDINVARSYQTEKGRLIRVVLNRPLGFLELRRSGRSTDYQFSVIEFVVDENGKGEGAALVAAKLRFNKNQLEVENYGQRPIRIANVRRH